MAKAKNISVETGGEENQSQLSTGSYVVKSEFRDINNWNNVYHAGLDVSNLDPERLVKLVAAGLVEKV